MNQVLTTSIAAFLVVQAAYGDHWLRYQGTPASAQQLHGAGGAHQWKYGASSLATHVRLHLFHLRRVEAENGRTQMRVVADIGTITLLKKHKAALTVAVLLDDDVFSVQRATDRPVVEARFRCLSWQPKLGVKPTSSSKNAFNALDAVPSSESVHWEYRGHVLGQALVCTYDNVGKDGKPMLSQCIAVSIDEWYEDENVFGNEFSRPMPTREWDFTTSSAQLALGHIARLLRDGKTRSAILLYSDRHDFADFDDGKDGGLEALVKKLSTYRRNDTDLATHIAAAAETKPTMMARSDRWEAQFSHPNDDDVSFTLFYSDGRWELFSFFM